jgi:hypothetical protein
MDTLKQFFVRDIVLEPAYIERLNIEIELLEKLDFVQFIVRFVEIFNKHIKKYEHLLRGSAASSLLLYYLDINQIDPIKYGIPLARFINISRMTQPDIDIDLPLHLRDNVITDIIENNNDTIRMSSKLKNEQNMFFESLIKEYPAINSVHNSGIIIFSDDQKQIIENNKITSTQIKLTKEDIESNNLRKIDLLSNTALEQLDKIQNRIGKKVDFDFNDSNVFNFMLNDDGCGVTYAESPLIQYTISILKPTSIEQLGICLAIIRPFACQNIKDCMTFDNLKDKVIYDDDFIILLVNKLKLSEEQADNIRRMFKKNINTNEMSEFIDLLNNSELSEQEKYKVKKLLPRLKSYGFCKSHSISYARLIYMLYFCKCYYPKIFWESTILSIKGYYNDWVYIRKGLECGLKFKGIKKCDPFYHFINTGYWLNKEFISKCYLKIIEGQKENTSINLGNVDDNDCSIDEDCDNDNNYANENNTETSINYDFDNYYLEYDAKSKFVGNQNGRKENEDIDKVKSTKRTIFCNKECEFRGIIAATTTSYTKYKKYQTILTIGYDNNKFVDLYLNKRRDFKKFKQVIGKGYYISDIKPHIIITHMRIF